MHGLHVVHTCAGTDTRDLTCEVAQQDDHGLPWVQYSTAAPGMLHEG